MCKLTNSRPWFHSQQDARRDQLYQIHELTVPSYNKNIKFFRLSTLSYGTNDRESGILLLRSTRKVATCYFLPRMIDSLASMCLRIRPLRSLDCTLLLAPHLFSVINGGFPLKMSTRLYLDRSHQLLFIAHR
jgi:hypothetical protein